MNYSIYASNRYAKHFEKMVHSLNWLSALQVSTLENATVVIDKISHKFGVFDSLNQFVPCSSQLRNKSIQTPPVYEPGKDFLDIDAVYLGTLEDHFGHFLLEHTGRMYAVLQERYRGKKCVMINNRQLPVVNSFVSDFCSMLGIPKSDLIILDTSIRIKCLHIPEVAFAIPTTTSRYFGHIFDAVADAVSAGGRSKKIYVSRLKLPERSTFGEEQIQHIFENNGFKVIYPEQMSLAEQVKHMKNCTCLAGIAGSALHLSLFMPAGGTVIQLKRNKPIKDNADTQFALCATKGCNFVVIDCSLEHLPTHHWSEFPQIIGPTKYLKAFLDDNGYSYSDSDLIPSSTVNLAYRQAFRSHGGFVRYQCKRMAVYIIPKLMLGGSAKRTVRAWLNKHL